MSRPCAAATISHLGRDRYQEVTRIPSTYASGLRFTFTRSFACIGMALHISDSLVYL